MSADSIRISTHACGHIHVEIVDDSGHSTPAVLDASEALEMAQMLINAAEAASMATGECDEPPVSREVH